MDNMKKLPKLKDQFITLLEINSTVEQKVYMYKNQQYMLFKPANLYRSKNIIKRLN